MGENLDRVVSSQGIADIKSVMPGPTIAVGPEAIIKLVAGDAVLRRVHPCKQGCLGCKGDTGRRS